MMMCPGPGRTLVRFQSENEIKEERETERETERQRVFTMQIHTLSAQAF